MYWYPLPNSPYANPHPEHTGFTFQNPPLPRYTGPPAVNVPLPPNNNNQAFPLPLHRLGEPIAPAHVPYDPRQAGVLQAEPDAPWDQVIQPARERPIQTGCNGHDNCNCAPEEVLPSAVPHNNDPWPWDMDNGNRPVSPGVARRQFAMRRPPRQRLRRRPSRASAFDEFTLAPRPSDWRPDYPARRRGLLRHLSRVRGKFCNICIYICLLIFRL
jgi:hypothetical protein